MPTARRRLADVAWLDQKMQLGFLRRKVASLDFHEAFLSVEIQASISFQ